jgi:hypothetical protein
MKFRSRTFGQFRPFGFEISAVEVVDFQRLLSIGEGS